MANVVSDRKKSPPFTRIQISAVLLSLLAYVIGFMLLHYLGRAMSMCALIPVVAVGWYCGMVPGIIAGVLSVPLNMFMHTVYGLNWWNMFIVSGAGVPGTIGIIIIGGIVGHIRDLNVRLNRHRDNLHQEVQMRTAELVAANEQLKAREQELRAINQQLTASQHQLRAAHQQLQANYQQLLERERGDRASREFLEKIFATTADGIMVTDEQGSIVRINQALSRMLGFAHDELIGKSTVEMSPHVDRGVQMVSELIEKGYVESFETEWYKDDGTLLPVEINIALLKNNEGNISGSVGSIRDISERKKAEEQRIRLSAVIEQAAESITLMSPDGTIQYVNEATVKLFGYGQEEVVGSNIFQTKRGKYDEKFYQEVYSYVSAGNVWTNRLTHRKKDGTTGEFVTTISPIRDSLGKIISLASISRDVTREINLEQQLRQGQKMEAIGTLAGGIAHDFNNILSAIIGYAEMGLLEKTTGPDDNQTYFSQILKAGNRAKDLVNQILAFSRQREQEKKVVKCSTIVEEALKLLRSTIPAHIEIRQNLTGSSDTIFADPTQIHQIFVNLCTNAAYAMREKGGLLEVSLHNTHVTPQLGQSAHDLLVGNYVELRVRDTGTGMEPSILQRIFDPFFTTKGPAEGTGMGLAVAHGIVKSHGGSITVESRLGEGSTFHVLLPQVDEEVEPEAVRLQQVLTGSERILFVDDEVALKEMTENMLSSLGYRVVARTSSIEAYEAFRAAPDTFDLVITDQSMPNWTGMELAEEILSLRSDIPIILCTGFSETVSPEKAKAAGIREFVMKPISRIALAEVIRRVLGNNSAEVLHEHRVPAYPKDIVPS